MLSMIQAAGIVLLIKGISPISVFSCCTFQARTARVFGNLCMLVFFQHVTVAGVKKFISPARNYHMQQRFILTVSMLNSASEI